ncbi:hypothetical protein LZ554_004604 [Drepanopeziza brunnea f. sp. 'monogermtubi']|nr:hypothetical protein LZ554_004604 [Drepanopeziza brunnea f. sp. 'monogermtubi']
MATKICRNFECGHQAYQTKDQDGNFILVLMLPKLAVCITTEAPEACLGCREAERVKEAAKDATEQKDQQALAVYTAQSALFEQQIVDAKDNPDLRAYIEKLLLTCEVMRWKKAMQIEIKAATGAIATGSSLNTTIAFNIATALEQLNRLKEGEGITNERLQKLAAHEKGHANGLLISSLLQSNTRGTKWSAILQEMEEIKRDYEQRVKDGFSTEFWDLKEQFENSWARAVDLMGGEEASA